jgi:GH15 family glucan-1,4-alpha-glucosidase
MAEWTAGSLKGFRGMGPVRVGNAAVDQVQNDIYGSVVLAANQMFYDQRLPKPAGIELYRQLERVGRKAVEAAFEPDAGLWEYRGRTHVHTFSSAMCWAAVNGLRRVAKRLGLEEERQRWGEAAESMRATILERAWRPDRNCFAANLEGEGLDASLLLLPEIGIVKATDERFLATLGAIERGLLRDGLVYRYDTADDFGLPETAFLVCQFWYIDALLALGRRDEARELFADLLARRNRFGLLSEDIHPTTGELWGNLPQTYSMAGIINSGRILSRSWQEAWAQP